MKNKINHIYRYPKGIILKESTYYNKRWWLHFPYLLDKYEVAFSLIIGRKYPHVEKFIIYRGKRDIFALLK